ncbi:MAG: SPOR domain-containing protein [Desulfobulbaceae bacterium]|nr:SPOR domain-containing protein [Desulfobulbaceae bacterium]
MAAPSKSKGYKIRFELSLAGLFGVGVVCFCIFLWMFLFGVWAGQTGLISGMSLPSPGGISETAKGEAPKRKLPPEPVLVPVPAPPAVTPAPLSAVPPPGGATVAVEPLLPPDPALVPAPAPTPAPATAPAPAPSEPRAKAPAPAFYSIQVGAFRASKNVEEELRLWRAQGYEAFSRPPGENERLIKVYVGRYPYASEAKKQAEVLAKKRKISPLIAKIKPD